MLACRAIDSTSFHYESAARYSGEEYLRQGPGSYEQELTEVYDLDKDGVIHGVRGTGEPRDMATLADRAAPPPEGTSLLYILDRAYAAYNCLVHLTEHNAFCLVRAKDVTSNGMAACLDFD